VVQSRSEHGALLSRAATGQFFSPSATVIQSGQARWFI
jgi:hypothetical protein